MSPQTPASGCCRRRLHTDAIGWSGPIPEISVEVDPTRAAELGIAAGEVAEAVRFAATGEIVGRVRVDDDPVDLLVGTPGEEEPWKRAVVLIRGSLVPIQSVASVFTALERPALLRRNQRPCVTPRARGISSEHLDAAVAGLPAGVTIEVGTSRRR